MTPRRVDAFHTGLPIGTAWVQMYFHEPTP